MKKMKKVVSVIAAASHGSILAGRVRRLGRFRNHHGG